MAMTLGLALAGSASAVVVYQDSFTRTGVLSGTAPDVVNINPLNRWNVGSDSAFTTNGTTAAETGSFFGSIYLPVNGTSLVTLNAATNFTLSVDVINASGGNGIGIMLATAPLYGTGNQFNSNGGNAGSLLAQIGFGSGSGGQIKDFTGDTQINIRSSGGLLSGTLALSYNASTTTISYLFNGVVQDTLVVTPAQINGLTAIGMGNGSFSSGSFDNFTLNVVPEPSTYAMMLGGLGGLALVLRRRVRNS